MKKQRNTKVAHEKSIINKERGECGTKQVSFTKWIATRIQNDDWRLYQLHKRTQRRRRRRRKQTTSVSREDKMRWRLSNSIVHVPTRKHREMERKRIAQTRQLQNLVRESVCMCVPALFKFENLVSHEFGWCVFVCCFYCIATRENRFCEIHTSSRTTRQQQPRSTFSGREIINNETKIDTFVCIYDRNRANLGTRTKKNHDTHARTRTHREREKYIQRREEKHGSREREIFRCHEKEYNDFQQVHIFFFVFSWLMIADSHQGCLSLTNPFHWDVPCHHWLFWLWVFEKITMDDVSI